MKPRLPNGGVLSRRCRMAVAPIEAVIAKADRFLAKAEGVGAKTERFIADAEAGFAGRIRVCPAGLGWEDEEVVRRSLHIRVLCASQWWGIGILNFKFWMGRREFFNCGGAEAGGGARSRGDGMQGVWMKRNAEEADGAEGRRGGFWGSLDLYSLSVPVHPGFVSLFGRNFSRGCLDQARGGEIGSARFLRMSASIPASS